MHKRENVDPFRDQRILRRDALQWLEKMKTAIKKIPPYANDNIVHMDGDRTILQACEKIGLFIPRSCYSESLSIAGNCRMCLVEIEKPPKSMASCAISIAPDMKIHTRTNSALRTRESILESLLINHPSDCPICDQGGECDLQDQVLVHGSDRGRFHEYKRSVEDKNAGPSIKTIMTRRTHRTRCIRFATEIAGVEAYGCSGRGKKMEVGTYILNSFDSESSGNVIDPRPVGASTSKPYAFTVRPWELGSIETVDVSDCLGTIVRMDVRGSELTRILPRGGWITDKTRFAYDGPKCQRLHFPLMRTKDQLGFYTAGWKNALTYAANLIGSARGGDAKKMAGIIGQSVDLETISVFKNSSNRLGIPGLCIQEQYLQADLDFRENSMPRVGLNKLENDLVSLVGVNPRLEASLPNANLRRLVLRSTKVTNVISIGYSTNLTYEKSHLGNGMGSLMRIALGKGPVDVIRSIARAERPVAMFGFEGIKREDGNSFFSLSNPIFKSCERLSLDSFATTRRRSSSPERREHNKVSGGRNRVPVETNVISTNASTPAACELGYVNVPLDVDCSYLIGADSDKTSAKDWIIYQGHHGDIGAQKATVILPPTAYSEKNGTYISPYHTVQQTKAAVQHCGEARDDHKIVRALADMIFGPSAGHLEESTWPLAGASSPAPLAADAKDIRAAGNLTSSQRRTVSRSSGRLRHVRNPRFVPPFDNFHPPDVMGRASKTMGKCASRSIARSSYNSEA